MTDSDSDSENDKVRAERMRSKRGAAKERGQSQNNEDSESETADTDTVTIKDELEQKLFYLPPAQKKRLDHVYNKLKADYEYEFDETFEKNRHYYRLVVEYGLDHLEDCEPSELQELLADIAPYED